MRRFIMASTAEWDGRGSLAAALVLLAACGPSPLDPSGEWEGHYVREDGERVSLDFTVGEESDYPTLHAFESARWQVHEVEGHIEGWFDFEGALYLCVDGPCRIDLYLNSGRPHDMPLVEEGAFYVLGLGTDYEVCEPPQYTSHNVRLSMGVIEGERNVAYATGELFVGGLFECVKMSEQGPVEITSLDSGGR